MNDNLKDAALLFLLAACRVGISIIIGVQLYDTYQARDNAFAGWLVAAILWVLHVDMLRDRRAS